LNILLIGKYPPTQGGISSKTYWLFRELEKRGFDFRAVTVETADYSIKGRELNGSKTTIINIKEIPWHIPESALLSERIFINAVKTAEAFKPDLIEVNYLWPFCMPAILVANILRKPLVIRHAGSDIQKFHNDTEFTDIMKAYFEKAAIVVTNRTVKTLIEKLFDNSGKLNCVRRYIPDPKIFKPESAEKKIDILFVGKINYRWNLKGINHLLGLIKNRNLKALFLTGGKYKNEILELIEKTGTRNHIEEKDFISPEGMPSIYNSCKTVWCWDETGGVEDFSNIIWEALFCGTACIVNSETAERTSNEGVPKGLMPLICRTVPERLMDYEFALKAITPSGLEQEKIALYDEYIESNVKLYEKLVKTSR